MQFISRHRFNSALVIAFLLCTGPAFAQGNRVDVVDQPSSENGIPDLVRAAPPRTTAIANAALAPANQSREVVRSRQVALDFSVLQKVRAGIAADQPQTMRVAFFEDAPLLIQITRTEPVGNNGTAYIGTVLGVGFSSAVIVEENGVVSGNVNVLSSKYQIRNFGEAGHVMQQIDVTALPPDHSPLPAPTPATAVPAPFKDSPVAAVSTAVDDGSLIDVMVVYTPAARISQGGTAAMKSLINLGVTETNNAYANSQVTQRVRLVYAGEVNYAEVDFATDLARLQGKTDGFMDDLHELRNLYGADLVSLWGNYPSMTGCGLSNLMTSEVAGFESQAFNIVDRNCATSNYSFAHELGHNMGLQHDTLDVTIVTPEGSVVPTQINYAHGYVDLNNRFRSIMATNSQCDAQMPAINCLRIPYFSNPNISFDNRAFFPAAAASAPTGVAATAHDSRALNDTRDTTANFRVSVNLTGPGTVIFSPSTYTVSENAGFITLSATRHAGAGGDVSVSYSSVSGTALDGVNFTAKTGILTWANSETGTKTITVPILQDGILDGPKAFSVTINSPTGGVSIGAPGGITASAAINILDADTDSFPPGCALPLTGWTNPPAGAATGWAVATDSFFGPPCSLKTNPTAAANKTQIQFEGTFTAGTISFARRVSSQSGSACLRFYVDNFAQNIGGTCASAGGPGASGEVAWGMVNIAVSAGPHILIWSYEKDSAGAAGADAAWIDSVVLPLAGSPLIQSALPPNGFLNIPYSHTFVATGAPTIQYAASLALPPGVTLNTANGVISGTPTTLGAFTGRITAFNGMLPNAQQSFLISITGAAPGAPIIGAATPGNTQARVSFSPPASAGSAPITTYTATCNPNAYTGSSATSPIDVTGLVNGIEYTCSVTATNAYGSGASSTDVLVTPVVTRPGPPAIATATAGNAQAFISFTAPGSDGGSPITGYKATCNPGALTGSAAISPVNVINLINGTAYTCSLTANNAIGASDASTAVTVSPSASATLSLIGVASRKTHGGSGTFDIPIDTAPPTAGLVTVEPRTIGSGHTIFFQFNYAISAAGTVTVFDSNNAAVVASTMASGNNVVVTIPTLADNRRVTISLTGVNGTAPVFSASPGFLLGDVNNSRSVDAIDLSGVKTRSGQATTAANFRFDVNASGAINASDISAVKTRLGLKLP